MMCAEVVNFRPISTSQADVNLYLGRGFELIFTINDEQGVLKISQSNGQKHDHDNYFLECKSGCFSMTHAEEFFGLLSKSSMFTPPQDENDGDIASSKKSDDQFPNIDTENLKHEISDLYWPYISLNLSPQISNIFGDLRANKEPLTKPVEAQLEVQIGGSRLKSDCCFSETTFYSIINNELWNPIKKGISSKLSLSFPNILGSLSISNASLKDLCVGDVLIPQQSNFNCLGEGTIDIGKHRLGVKWQQNNQQYGFIISEIKNNYE